jgi:hypothetical protein
MKDLVIKTEDKSLESGILYRVKTEEFSDAVSKECFLTDRYNRRPASYTLIESNTNTLSVMLITEN